MSKLMNRTGRPVPEVTFRTRQDGDWKDISSSELFAGKRVLLFALPGAFTPTCSSSHLPRYEELYDSFQRAGIDAMYCLSVNDAFTMNAWGKAQGIEKVQLLPDGNGAFSRGMEMLVDKSELGFGDRSWRYAMVANDGVIEAMFIEPQVPGDPFEVSDADSVLQAIAPQVETPLEFSLFTRAGCPHCARAKALLRAEGALYEEIPLSNEITARSLLAVSGATSVPQVFRSGERIGGADELQAWFADRRSQSAA